MAFNSMASEPDSEFVDEVRKYLIKKTNELLKYKP